MSRRPLLPTALLLPLLAVPTGAASTAVLQGPDLPDGEAIRVVRLEHAEVGDAATILRSMLGLRNVGLVGPSNTLFLRDSVERLELAAELLDEIDRPRIAVGLDVRVLAVEPATWRRLNGEASGDPLRLPEDRLARLLGDDGVRLLARPRLDVSSGEGGRLLIGERIPIRVGDGALQYQDVGLEIEVTPRVHRGGEETTLDLRVGSSRRVGESAHPVVEAGELRSKPRLRRGESLLVTDLVFDGPGLGDDLGDDELVLVLTPRVDPPV